MSNLSKGTGSRKDTKMRIRAFPVSAREGREATARGPAGPAYNSRRAAGFGLAWPGQLLASPGPARPVTGALSGGGWHSAAGPPWRKPGCHRWPRGGGSGWRPGGPQGGWGARRPAAPGKGDLGRRGFSQPLTMAGLLRLLHCLFCFVEGLQLPWKTL